MCTFHVKKNNAILQWYSCSEYKAPGPLVYVAPWPRGLGSRIFNIFNSGNTLVLSGHSFNPPPRQRYQRSVLQCDWSGVGIYTRTLAMQQVLLKSQYTEHGQRCSLPLRHRVGTTKKTQIQWCYENVGIYVTWHSSLLCQRSFPLRHRLGNKKKRMQWWCYENFEICVACQLSFTLSILILPIVFNELLIILFSLRWKKSSETRPNLKFYLKQNSLIM